MPPRTRRARPSDRRAAAASGRSENDAKPSGIFHFVSVNPSSELQKSENRSVIRSHASKYIWRQHRAIRTDANTNSKPYVPPQEPPLISPTSTCSKPSETQWPTEPEHSVLEDSIPLHSLPEEPSLPPSSLHGNDAKIETDIPSSTEEHARDSPETDDEKALATAANMYAKENDTVPGPFNQIVTWLGDPLHTYPSMLGGSAISKLMRYAAFDLWPGLVLGAGNQKWDHEVAAANWLPRAMENPALFTAFMYGAAGHMQTRKRLESTHVTPQTREEKLEQIICETETIKQLNKMMLDPRQGCTDEVILAVLCMAFNKIDYSKWTADNHSAPKAPLRNLQWLDVYGGLSLNDQHVKGLMALIQTRGGLGNITMPGLAETLSTSAIMLSTKFISRPRLPFIPVYKESATGNTPRWPQLNNPSDPFSPGINIDIDAPGIPVPPANNDIFFRAGMNADLATVLRNMQNYNAVVNLYCQGLLPGIELAVIADRRNWIQYRLLSLPSLNEFPDDFFYSNRSYEPTRYAAMIYSTLVIFPLPAANRPFVRLCSLLKSALAASDIDNGWVGAEATEILLWVVVMGGMAATGTPCEEWFIGAAVRVTKAAQIESWGQLKGILTGILWMESVCDVGGLMLWNSVMVERKKEAARIAAIPLEILV
ncbi:hypothetical protein FQN52_002677 [Onygenales sp. PD_12]|nr:hypothetical protein FQN52_002677 [Onygenales sp. PD_12]